MFRHRWSAWGAACCALLLALPAAAAPVPGEQDKPLAQVPAKAPLVVQLRGFERTRDRLNTLIKNAMPDFAGPAKQKMDDALKEVLNGRELKGLSKDGPIFLVFTELPNPNQNPPKMAVLVPVTSYETFRNGLLKEEERKNIKTDPQGYESALIDNEPTYFVNRKNSYAVVTPDAEVAVSFTKKYDGLAGKLSKAFAQRFLEADASVYVDMAVVNKEHADDIKQMRGEIERMMEASPDKTTAELAKRVLDPVFQAISDSKAVLVTADVRPDGLKLHSSVEVASDSKTGLLLSEWKSLPLSEVGKLPGGQMIYSGFSFAPGVGKLFGPLLFGIQADPDSEEGKAVLKATAALSDAKPRQRLDAANVPLRGLQVWKYDDAVKAVAAQEKLFAALKAGMSYQTVVLDKDPVVNKETRKQGGFEFHSVSLKFDLEKTVDKQTGGVLNEDAKKQMIELLKETVGESMEVWYGTDGKVVLQVIARDWTAARDLVDHYQKGEATLSQSEPYKEVAKQMPANTSTVMLIDLPRYSEVVMKGVLIGLKAGGLPLPPGLEKPAVPGKTSFLGVAVTTEPGVGGFDLWLSASSVNQIYKMYLEKLLRPNF
jgi:hypothetical protein